MNRRQNKFSPDIPEQVRSDYLTTIAAFARLAPHRLNRLLPYLHIRAFAADETIYNQGDPPGAAFFLLSGSVNLFHEESASRRDRIRVVAAGASLGHAALLPAAPQLESAIAVEPVRVLVLLRADFDTLIIKEPLMATAILQGVLEEVLENARVAFTAYWGLTNQLTAANIIV